MGWLYKYVGTNKLSAKEKKELVEEDFDLENYEILKSSMVGKVYYAAARKKGTEDVWCQVVLTDMMGYEFGTKVMDETVCPYCFDCPKGILDLLTPTDNEYANEWRKECRKKANEKGWEKRVPLGGKIKYKTHDGKEIELIKHPPAYQFKTWFWFCPSEGVYLKKKNVIYDRVTIIEEKE